MAGESREAGELQLVQRARRGDREALGALYDRHSGVMLALAVRWSGDRQAAEDLVHDVFMEAWRKIRSYEPERGTLRTWLVRILKSRWLDRRRSQGRSRETLLDHSPEGVAEPSRHAGELSGLGQELNGLSEPEKVVVRLAYFDGWTMQEIGSHLGEPTGTVKARLSRALARLRERMRGNEA